MASSKAGSLVKIAATVSSAMTEPFPRQSEIAGQVPCVRLSVRIKSTPVIFDATSAKSARPSVRCYGILAGTVLTFARAAGEFGATMMFAGNIPGQTQTMSTAIYAAVQANDYDSAFRYTTLLALCSIVFMLAVNVVTSKRGGK